MKRICSVLFFIVVFACFSATGYAARQTVTPSGPVDATGITGGVDMTAQGGGGLLTVGTIGGPQTDIYTDNSNAGAVINPTLLAVSSDVSSFSNITFNSSSNVYGAIGVQAGPFFNEIRGGYDTATVNFLGAVFATRTYVEGTGTLNFNSGSTNVTALLFEGDGKISLAPNTTVIGALTNPLGANTGTLELGNMSILDGAVGGAIGLKAVNVVGGSNTAGGSATITGALNTYSLSLGTNTLNIGGALTLHDGSVINTTLASPTLYGSVAVGAANIGATLGVNVLIPSTAYIPVGTQFNIINAGSGTDGSMVLVTVQNPTNPLYTFAATPLAGTLDGRVTIETLTIPLQAGAQQPLAGGVVPVLLTIPTTPDLIDILTSLNALTDPAAVASAEIQLVPSTAALASPLVTFQNIRQFENLWMSRPDNTLCDQIESVNPNSDCSDGKLHNGWWAKSFGYFADQNAKDGLTEYDSRNLGAMIAYDMPLDLDTHAGLGVGYGRSTIDGKTYDANINFDTYQATAYITHDQGPWFVNGNASFGWNEYAGMRHIVFPGVDRTANSEYTGQDYTAFASTGFHLPVSKFTLTPLASLQYSRVHITDYIEKGAGDIDLKVDAQDYNFLESGLGVKLERTFDFRGMAIVPETHFKWFHELNNPKISQTASFTAPGSSSFTTAGSRTDDDMYNVGTGVTLLSCKCKSRIWSVEAVYDFDWRNDGYFAHQVMLRFTSRF